MMISDSGLLFWATLYMGIQQKKGRKTAAFETSQCCVYTIRMFRSTADSHSRVTTFENKL